MDAEVILHLLRHVDHEMSTRLPTAAAKVVNQQPLAWIREGLEYRKLHPEHPFWYARATSHIATHFCTRPTGRRPKTRCSKVRHKGQAMHNSLRMGGMDTSHWGRP